MSLRGVMRRPDPAYARPFDPTSAAPARPCDNPIQHGSQWLSRSQRLPHPIIVRHQPPPCHSDEISGNLTRIARQGVVDSRPVVVVSFSSVQRGEIDAARYRKGIAGWSPGGRRGQTRYGHQGPDQRRLRKPWFELLEKINCYRALKAQSAHQSGTQIKAGELAYVKHALTG
jgi:hypothetical protein